MLGKFLITLAVIIIAFFFIRQRKTTVQDMVSPPSAAKRAQRAAERSEFSSDLRFAAYMTLALMVGLGGLLYFFRWQDDHQVLTITLHRDNQAEPVRYQVFKYQLQDRSFVTIDGTTVNVASSERMEVQGLDP